MKKIVMLIGVICGITTSLVAQQKKERSYPVIGDTLQNVVFTDLINHNKGTLSLSEYKGKWIILDIWGIGCVACIRSFPRMDSLARAFEGKAKVVIVALTDLKDANRKSKEVVGNMIKKYDLGVTFAFDSLARQRYDIYGVPFVLVINPEGILVAKTGRVDSVHLASMIGGKIPKLPYSYSESEPKKNDTYNTDIPLLTNGIEANGGNDTGYVFRSLLSLANDETPAIRGIDLYGSRYQSMIKRGRIELLHNKIDGLLQTAYFGTNDWSPHSKLYDTLYPRIVWNTRSVIDKERKYCYSVSMPAKISSAAQIMKVMRNDLENYFNITGHVEVREMPVYYLAVSDPKKFDKLKTTNNAESQKSKSEINGMHYANKPMSLFYKVLTLAMKLDAPAYNDTGYDGNVTVEFEANMGQPDEIKAALERYGLKISKGTKKMKIIVVTDPSN